MVGITESKLNRNKKHLATIDLPNYSIEHCPADGANGGALLYIKEDLIYKLRNDLKMFKNKELESIFAEIINPKHKNVIGGCIYYHPCMKLKKFNNDFMTYLSNNLLKEKNKHIILMGDFNTDMLKYENDIDTADFLDQIYAFLLLPHITSPTRVNPRSKTLIDNIFSTDTNEDVTSGNILTSISDHLAQFLLFPLSHTNRDKKKEICKRTFKHFKAENFLNDVQNIDWDQALKTDKKLVDKSFDKFFKTFELLLETHVPLKRLSNAEVKFSSKPWTTNAIKTSIRNKDRFCKRILRTKNLQQKETLYDKFKRYRNYVSILTRKSKANHYNKFFQEHKKKCAKHGVVLNLLLTSTRLLRKALTASK